MADGPGAAGSGSSDLRITAVKRSKISIEKPGTIKMLRKL